MVVRGATIIDVADGHRLLDQTVVIVGNRVQVVDSSKHVRIPKGARIVDARGKYLIPGLWDMHVHPMDQAELDYPLFLANGVTGIRDAGSNVPLATLGRWKQEIAAGRRVGPRMIVAGPSLESPGPLYCGPRRPIVDNSHQLCVVTPEEGRLAVDWLKAAGADFIKTHNLSWPTYFAIAAEARRVDIPFGGHVPKGETDGGLQASDSGASIIDHDEFLQLGKEVCQPSSSEKSVRIAACAAAARRLRQNGTWFVTGPFQNVPQVFPALTATYRRYIPRQSQAHNKSDPEVAGALPTSLADWAAALPPSDLWEIREAAGLPMLAGTDGSKGFGLHEALVYFVAGGMTPLGALQTATLNPAQYLRATDSLGTVAAGKVADLVLLDADPLIDIWNTTKIRAVIANGRYFDRAALDHLLADAERAAQVLHPRWPRVPKSLKGD